MYKTENYGFLKCPGKPLEDFSKELSHLRMPVPPAGREREISLEAAAVTR